MRLCHEKETELTEGKNWTCEIYPEEYGDSLEYILHRLDPSEGFWSEGAQFWYILHDCDKYSDDDLEVYKLKHNGELPSWKPDELKNHIST